MTTSFDRWAQDFSYRKDVTAVSEEEAEIQRKVLLQQWQQMVKDHLAETFGKVSRTLARQKILVRFADEGPAPAWSNDGIITINSDGLTLTDLLDLSVMLGLNIHEVLHEMFTPRGYTEIKSWAVNTGNWPSMNGLEDQRIETLGCSLWRSAGHRLTVMMRRFVITDTSKQLHPLVHGRKYLPVAVRQFYRDKWENEFGTATEMGELIDEYRCFTFPTDTERAKVVIQRYTDLLREAQTEPPDGCGRAPHSEPGGMPETEDKQKELVEKRPPEEDTTDTPSPEKGEGQDDLSEDGDSAEGDSADEEGDSAGEEDGDAAGGNDGNDGGSTKGGAANGGGASNDKGAESNQADPLEDLDKEIENLKASGAFDDMERAIDRARDAAAEYDPNPKGNVNTAKVSPQALTADDRMKDAFKALYTHAKAGKRRRVSRGRVNVQRWVNTKDPAIAFDKWSPEQRDAASIEIVVLVDNSGSVGNATHELTEMAWVIKHACESLPGPQVTVITFNSGHRVLYGAKEKAEPTQARRINAGGGTNPTTALAEARWLFDTSDKKSKLLFVLTDGEWWDTEILSEWNRKNFTDVSTHLIGILGYKTTSKVWETHGLSNGANLSINQFVQYVERYVVDDMRSRLK